MLRILVTLLFMLGVATDAQAYIGPGSGVGLLGSLWAWLVGFAIVLMAILIWPIRWALRRLRAKSAQADTNAER